MISDAAERVRIHQSIGECGLSILCGLRNMTPGTVNRLHSENIKTTESTGKFRKMRHLKSDEFPDCFFSEAVPELRRPFLTNRLKSRNKTERTGENEKRERILHICPGIASDCRNSKGEQIWKRITGNCI